MPFNDLETTLRLLSSSRRLTLDLGLSRRLTWTWDPGLTLAPAGPGACVAMAQLWRNGGNTKFKLRLQQKSFPANLAVTLIISSGLKEFILSFSECDLVRQNRLHNGVFIHVSYYINLLEPVAHS